jgi:hypothetical protein
MRDPSEAFAEIILYSSGSLDRNIKKSKRLKNGYQ